MERLNLDKVKIIAAAATLAMFAGAASAHVKFEGQVNRMASFTRDGHQNNVLFLDNAFSPSSVGFLAHHHLNKCTLFGGQINLLTTPNNSRVVSQVRNTDRVSQVVFVRNADLWMTYGQFGKLSLGYGDAASYGITRMSYAGAGDTVSSAQVGNLAGGMEFHSSNAPANALPAVPTVYGNGAVLAGGTSLNPTVDLAFNSLDGVGAIYDLTGLNAAKNRIRWDSANFWGFMASVSHGQVQPGVITANNSTSGAAPLNTRVFTDVALRYEGNFTDFMLSAGVAYAQWSHDFYNSRQTNAVVANTGTGSDTWTQSQVATRGNRLWAGSVAAEHKCTGLNIAASYGNLRKMAPVLNNTKSWFIQVGKHNSWTHYGQTDLVVDYFHGKDTLVNADKSVAWSLGVVQNLDKVNSQVYATYRQYKYDGAVAVKNTTLAGAGAGVNTLSSNNYDKINVFSLGVLFKFSAML